MHIVARLVPAAALAAVLCFAQPAPAAPFSNHFANHVTLLGNLAAIETDPAKKAALEQAIALFDNTSKSFAADLIDGQNVVKKLEAAYGTSSSGVTNELDSLVVGSSALVIFRGQQAFAGAAQKIGIGNIGALARLSRVHTAQVNRFGKAFPAQPDPSISRVRRFKAMITFEKYAANLAKRYKVQLNDV